MSVKIGFIGAGRMTNLHMDCLEQIPGAEVVAVCDPNLERTGKTTARCGATPYSSVERMLDAESLDAVYVCSPTTLHHAQCLQLAERRIPFFMEKPLALRMDEAWQMVEAVERAGILTCVDFHWRYTEAVARATEIVAGHPLALVAAEWLWCRSPVIWIRDRNLAGGQVVDQTIHLTDLCQLFAGPVVELYAAYTLNTYADEEFHNWDGYSLAFKHSSGAVGSLRCTYALFEEIIETVHPHVDLSARELFLRITEQGLQMITPAGKREWPNRGLFHLGINRAFVAAIETGDAGRICTSVPESLRSLAFTLAANESARRGELVRLDEFMAATRPVSS
jgi:myo-inositol 2-dehydrogenase / D-chiro-inositol 1-dehydrogenase